MAMAGLGQSSIVVPLGVSTGSSSSQQRRRRPATLRCNATSTTVTAPAISRRSNFYEVLGLSQDVDLSGIKTAYRSMARQLHPDVCPREQREECTAMFILLQEAYETLSDPRRRAMYDMAISGALDSHGIARYQEFNNGDWRSQWSDQLWRLKRRSEVKEAQEPESWAARMRRSRE